MTSATAGGPSLVWAHRGPGTEWWLRVETPTGGRLVLRRHGKRITEVPLDAAVDPGQSDVVLDPARALAAVDEPAGVWRLELDTPDGRHRPFGNRARATAGLRRHRAVVGDAPFVLEFNGRAGRHVCLAVEPHHGWAELGRVAVDGGALTVAATVVPPLAPATAAVWYRRGTVDRLEVPLRWVDGAHVVCRTDLTLLSSSGHDDIWDLYLRCHDTDVRVGWHLDDVADKRRAVTLPIVDLTDTGGDRDTSAGRSIRTAEPYLTAHNNLSIRFVDPGRPPTPPVRDRSRRAKRDAPRRRQRIARTGDVEAPDPTALHLMVRRTAMVVLAFLAARARRRRHGARLDPDGPVHLLLANAFGFGGTVRTTFNVANELARRRQVRLASVYRLEERQPFDLDPRVELRTLVDYLWMETRSVWDPRSWLRRFALRVPTVLIHHDDPRHHRFNLWTDLQLLRWIRSIRHGTIVATRPGLNVAVAQFARPGVVLVGQQHLPHDFLPTTLWRHLLPWLRELHAVTVPTKADADRLRDLLGRTGPRVARMPNPLGAIDPPPSSRTPPRIVAAGRHNHTKGIDLLLEAFAAASARHPEWELRVYGQAKPQELAWVRRRIRELHLSDQVRLMPPTSRLELELSKASICAVASRFEAFGMVIIEAMSCGLPVVAFDCPSGPREIITHDHDGLLVPPQDTHAFARALERLMTEPATRDRLGIAARQSAARFAPDRVADVLEDVIATAAGAPRSLDASAAGPVEAQTTGGRP